MLDLGLAQVVANQRETECYHQKKNRETECWRENPSIKNSHSSIYSPQKSIWTPPINNRIWSHIDSGSGP